MSENIENKHDENLELKETFGDKLLDHDYDGIRELNNPAPGWVMAIFYITIAFSIYYGVHYFMLDGPSQDEEYAIKSAEHDQKYADAQASTAVLELLTDEASIAAGKELYVQMNCAVCHGTQGEGNAIGPNLTDNSWIHGCDFNSVFDIIKNGNPTKGMTAFKAQMTDAKIQQISSYLLVEMKGSNPENPKEAQGEICE